MKNLKVFYFIALMAVLIGCKKEEELSVSITQQPTGGYRVNSLSLSIDGKILVKKPKKSFSVTVQWWWEDGNHSNQKVQKTESFDFDSPNSTIKTSSYSAGSGYHFLNYFWVKITWTDDKGSHTLESSKVYCTG